MSPEELRILLFQAVRELCAEVVKHARAPHADVYVHADRDQIWIVVDDAGEGLDRSKRAPAFDQKGGFGLFTIREIHGIRKAGDLDLGRGEHAIGYLPSVADMCQQNVIDFAKACENRAVEIAIEVKDA